MAKYCYKKNLSLQKDSNDYCISVYSYGDTKKCNFYINDELVFQGIPFRKGNSIKVLKSGYFINVRDSHGTNRVVRDGKVVLSTRYSVANAFVRMDLDDVGSEYIADDEYLIVVTRNGKYGLYSSKRKMLLGLKYSTIDIDESFTIILGEKVDLDLYSDESKEEMLNCMRNGEYMQIGKYSKRYGYIETKGAGVDEENNVYIFEEWDEDLIWRYYWNDGFQEEIENCNYDINVPSNWDDYSYDDSLYDALDGQMDAIWNID